MRTRPRKYFIFTFHHQINGGLILAQLVDSLYGVLSSIRCAHILDDQRHALLILVHELVPVVHLDDLTVVLPLHRRLGETLALELQNGRAADAGVRFAVLDHQGGLFGLPVQGLNGALDRKLGTARDVTSRGLGNAGVDAGILGLHVLEDQGQGVLVLTEEHLETLLGIELLAIALPAEDWLLTSWQDLSTKCAKGIFVL